MAEDIGINVQIGDDFHRVEIRADRQAAEHVTYANISKFSRLGIEFVLDFIQVDPAEFHLVVEDARAAVKADSEIPPLEVPGKVVARIFMSPNLVKGLQAQTAQILEGIAIVPAEKDGAQVEEVQ